MEGGNTESRNTKLTRHALPFRKSGTKFIDDLFTRRPLAHMYLRIHSGDLMSFLSLIRVEASDSKLGRRQTHMVNV